MKDDVSCSLRRNNVEKIPEREVTTYPTNKTTLKEPRLAEDGQKRLKSVVKETTYLLWSVARGKRWRAQRPAVYYTIAGSYGITSCVTFSYPGGYSYVFLLF